MPVSIATMQPSERVILENISFTNTSFPKRKKLPKVHLLPDNQMGYPTHHNRNQITPCHIHPVTRTRSSSEPWKHPRWHWRNFYTQWFQHTNHQSRVERRFRSDQYPSVRIYHSVTNGQFFYGHWSSNCQFTSYSFSPSADDDRFYTNHHSYIVPCYS